MTVAARWRAARMAGSLRSRATEQSSATTGPDAAARQLALLNAEWDRVAGVTRYWGDLVANGQLPPRFESLEEFRQKVPPTTRAGIQIHHGSMTSRGAAPDFWRMTGGSTAKPVQLPAWSSETEHLRPETWLGRSWYGVTPASRLFLIWGHAHLLGSGWRGTLRAWRVRLSDRALGYHRFSAYDLRPERLQAAAEQMIRFRPDYLIGYSVALDRFARENAAHADRLQALGLKVVIGTAEGFPFPDTESRLTDLFGCPVGMEYGAVETGVIAHTRPGGGYEVYWNSCLLETERTATGWSLLVTTLYPRCFPLVRYEIGDEIEPEAGEPEIGFRRFKRVIGRCNDSVTLQDGSVVHSELFTHAVRPCVDVRGYQVVQEGDEVRIHYVSGAPLAPESERGILQRLGRIHPRLAEIRIVRVESLESTVAGKTRMVIRQDRNAV